MANKIIKRHGLKAALAVAALFAAQAASANDGIVAGDFIKLANGPGDGPGGEFIATFMDGTNSFETFCLEKNEYFSYFGQKLKVDKVNTDAVNGGSLAYGGPNPDPISYKTAYLYTQFRKGTLSSYDYGTPSLRIGDANELQNAFWYLENEIGSLASGSQAQTWVDEATAAGWTSIGEVRVLNLLRESTTGVFDIRAQDQLTLVPEPETYAMILAGLGLMGFVARRRKQNAAA